MHALLATKEGLAMACVADEEGMTPLHHAVEEVHTEVVLALLATGQGRRATGMQAGCEKQTPLHLAAQKGCSELVEAMLVDAEGAKALQRPDAEGNSPLHSMCTNKLIKHYQ